MFIFDIVTDELCLIKGIPEISQYFTKEKFVNENLEENVDGSATIDEDQSNSLDQSPKQHLKIGPAFIKRSVKVICFIDLICNNNGLGKRRHIQSNLIRPYFHFRTSKHFSHPKA